MKNGKKKTMGFHTVYGSLPIDWHPIAYSTDGSPQEPGQPQSTSHVDSPGSGIEAADATAWEYPAAPEVGQEGTSWDKINAALDLGPPATAREKVFINTVGLAI
jgi:hypothetical protein